MITNDELISKENEVAEKLNNNFIEEVEMDINPVLTDLSKVFYCLNYQLLITKLVAYGFSHEALAYIYTSLTTTPKNKNKIFI